MEKDRTAYVSGDRAQDELNVFASMMIWRKALADK